MKTITEFYQNLKNNFSKIDQCSFWNKYDWSEEGYENSFIITEIAREISQWNTKSECAEFDNLFQIIENGFLEYDIKTSSLLATDFLVSLMEIKEKRIRDEIKKFMRSKTQEKYGEMLKFYRET